MVRSDEDQSLAMIVVRVERNDHTYTRVVILKYINSFIMITIHAIDNDIK